MTVGSRTRGAREGHLRPLRVVGPALLGAAAALAAPAASTTVPQQRVSAVEDADLALERSLAALVSEERAARRVRELAALGPRMGGTASGNAAASWRLRAFQAERMATRLLEDPETWCHAERAWSVVARAPGAEPLALASAAPWGFSPPGAGRAPLSTEPADGAAWLVASHPRLRARDTVPLLALVDGETTLDGRYPVLRHLRPGDANPYPVFGLSRADGAALRALAARGAVEVEYALEATIERARPRTVVGHVRARPGAPPGFVLFCAHGDSDAGGPGANDNASGESILFEIAAAWTRAVREGLVEAPRRELRFAVWGKEMHSSRAYLDQHMPAEEDPAPLLAVVNFDQSGFGSAFDRLYVEPDDLPANRALVDCLLGVLDDHAGREGFPAEWATTGSLGGTDSYVFSDSTLCAERPFPALLLYASAWGTPRERPRTPGQQGESWRASETVAIDHDVHYHSTGDTPENTTDREPWNMAWSARVALLGVRRWLAGLD